MTSEQFIAQKERISNNFRRYGIDGENAFQVLAYQYVICYPQKLLKLPSTIISKWEKNYSLLNKESILIKNLKDMVTQDPLGDKLSEWYQFFIGRKYREGSGKFFTPKPVASVMAKLLPFKKNPVIMDSTCGAGTFLAEASYLWRHDECTLVANDVEASLVELTMLNLELVTSKKHIKHYLSTNIFDPTLEFIKWYNSADYILANPPFSLKIEQEQFESNLFSSGYRNSDALFIDTALKLLKPDGRLICILPHSIIANKEFSNLRSIVEKSWNVLGVICLPEGIFHLSAGTTTRADIVILEKKSIAIKRNHKLLFASVPSAGIRLNKIAKPNLKNDLETLIVNSDVREVLGI